MGGFVLSAKSSHGIELPAGTWIITLMAPRVMYLHEEQVVLRNDQRLSLSEHIPTEFFNVTITSDPPGARVRVDGLPNMFTTPHNGPIVPGSHRFQFFMGGCDQDVGSRYRSRWYDHRRETPAIAARSVLE
jgi:hypothetical protein